MTMAVIAIRVLRTLRSKTAEVGAGAPEAQGVPGHRGAAGQGHGLPGLVEAVQRYAHGAEVGQELQEASRWVGGAPHGSRDPRDDRSERGETQIKKQQH